ncbi:MAG: ATP-grasp domain-containing protein [Treponema sp.]|jgi:biotin carboxylase|nr:ATP-grasp domain-containing protein [Treponema sp.]
MKETLIILGAGVMQGPAIKIAKELGFNTVALDGSKDAPCISMADRFEQIDLKDKEGIETFARSLKNSCSNLGIMTAGTDFSASVAWTAEKLNLLGIPYEAALNASDKSRMRECFKKAGISSPDFMVISEDSFSLSSTPFNEALDRFPLVLKPVDNMGSRGCRRVDTPGEFYEAARAAIGFSRSGRAIAESYMDGPEFSVDAVYYRGEITICGLADRHIFFPPYFIEMGHTMPATIEEEKQQALLETFRAGVRALGLAGKDSIGAAKGDIKLTACGPMIGEIAARLSGGYMSGWTYPYSSGASPIKAAILMAMGKEPQGLNPAKNWTSAERAFISIPGTVKQITRIDEQRTGNNEYINDFFLRIKEGDKVSFPENNVTKCGNIIASAPDRQSAVIAAETAARSVLIRLESADEETRKFLLNKSGSLAQGTFIFPPDAFQLTEELKQALEQLPDYNEANIRARSIRTSSWLITPFNSFESSCLTDYMGRTVKEALEAARLLTGFPLKEAQKNAENNNILGRSFWAALIRGSYQGAVYYIDNLGV